MIVKEGGEKERGRRGAAEREREAEEKVLLNCRVYLENWLGLEEVATLEPVPGIPPTAGHLGSLLERFSDTSSADFIIRAPFQSEKPSFWLSERSGIPAIMLPLTVGGSKQAEDLFSLFDDILDRLLGAESS